MFQTIIDVSFYHTRRFVYIKYIPRIVFVTRTRRTPGTSFRGGSKFAVTRFCEQKILSNAILVTRHSVLSFFRSCPKIKYVSFAYSESRKSISGYCIDRNGARSITQYRVQLAIPRKIHRLRS